MLRPTKEDVLNLFLESYQVQGVNEIEQAHYPVCHPRVVELAQVLPKSLLVKS
jgi:hypothetical protein